MTIHQFKISHLAILSFIFITITSANEEYFPTDDNADLMKNGVDALQKGQSNKLPAYLHKQYGIKGKNYDLDEKGNPYIWCEDYNKAICHSNNINDCMKLVKCTSERKTHQLGCMAVFVYNTTRNLNNFTDILKEPALKGCWSQEAEELRECHAHDECVVDLRGTGNKDRSAQFCCCRTHNCNQVISFQELNMTIINQNQKDNIPEKNEESSMTNKVEDGTDYTVYVLAGASVIASIVLIVTVFICRRNKKKRVRRELVIDGGNITPVASPNTIPMRRLEYNAQCMAFINGKLIDLRNVELKEKISRGRFGEVYRGEIEGAYLAVKLCGRAELDSWVNEQDIYTIRPMRKHDNIAEFVASFEFNSRYWLVTQYYSLGSLFDYLQRHTVSLVECAKIIAGFLNGLAFLHEDKLQPCPKPTIIHRDFKSKNVLMKDNLTSCISDFGLAMKYDGGTLADELHGQVGTRRYMAPEVLEGATEFTSFAFQQIDVYAAALVMWEVLNRTEILPCPDGEPLGVPPAKLPYEAEIGLSPTLGPLRELVVLKKMRPKIRECMLSNPSAKKLITTMQEMWEMEPDARITSGCARDRVLRVYFDVSGVPFKTEMDINEVIPEIPVIPLAKNIIRPNTHDDEEFVATVDGDAETAFLERKVVN